jgi:hypothetical protein
MKSRTLRIISICVGVVLSAALLSALLISQDFSAEIVTTLITFVLVILVFSVIQVFRRRRNKITHDEFTVHQDLKSFRNSWISTLLATSIMSNLDLLGIYSFKLNVALGVVLYVMVLSFWISHFIYINWPRVK